MHWFPPSPCTRGEGTGVRGRSGIGTRIEEYKENDATFGINGIDRLVVEIDASEYSDADHQPAPIFTLNLLPGPLRWSIRNRIANRSLSAKVVTIAE